MKSLLTFGIIDGTNENYRLLITRMNFPAPYIEALPYELYIRLRGASASKFTSASPKLRRYKCGYGWLKENFKKVHNVK